MTRNETPLAPLGARPSPLLAPTTEATAVFHECLGAKAHPSEYCSPPEPATASLRVQGRPQTPETGFCLHPRASPSLAGHSEWTKSNHNSATTTLSSRVQRHGRERHFPLVSRGSLTSLLVWTWEGRSLISLVNISPRLGPQLGPSVLSAPSPCSSLNGLFLPRALT